MLNELKHITKSQKFRVLILLVVLAVVATVVVFAIDGADGYQDYVVGDGYHYEYTMQEDDYNYYVGYGYVNNYIYENNDEYDYDGYDYNYAYNPYSYTPYNDPYGYNNDGEYFASFYAAAFGECISYEDGEAGDAPIMVDFDLLDE
ncbi:MAG: hypothetical protein FWC92_00675 [Defluviitaleaceae bacterium]|nr:hypothetical protein [Defluviitaleaceae bacterium]